MAAEVQINAKARDTGGMIERHLHRDHAAQRHARDSGPPDPRRIHDVSHVVGEHRQRVVATRRI